MQVADGLLGALPFGAVSLVGVRSMDEARRARESGADALFVKHELIEGYKGDARRLMLDLQAATDGDD